MDIKASPGENPGIMRTTLTLDDDVAKELQTLQSERQTSWREVVNEVLRLGLHRSREQMSAKRGRRYRLEPVDLGPCRIPSLDPVGAVLDLIEGETRK